MAQYGRWLQTTPLPQIRYGPTASNVQPRHEPDTSGLSQPPTRCCARVRWHAHASHAILDPLMRIDSQLTRYHAAVSLSIGFLAKGQQRTPENAQGVIPDSS